MFTQLMLHVDFWLFRDTIWPVGKYLKRAQGDSLTLFYILDIGC
jgi:hypothetical protein